MPDKAPPIEIEVDVIDCAECGVPIKTLWHKGLLPSEDYLLIADSIFHPDCWNQMLDRYEGNKEVPKKYRQLIHELRHVIEFGFPEEKQAELEVAIDKLLEALEAHNRSIELG